MTEHTHLTRRRLLAMGGAAGATAAVPAGTARAGRVRPTWQDRDALASRVGETFVVRSADGGSVALRLRSVRDAAGTTPRGRTLKGRDDAYVLIFKPVSGTVDGAGQAIRTFSHPQLGSTELFATVGDGIYNVVVNRTVSLGAGQRWSSAAVRMGKRRAPRRRRRLRRR